jgi:HEPN domain-containing protein
MQNSTPPPGSPEDWLRHAQSDLALAQARKTRRLLYEHLCFHAQQAAEKAIKAVLVAKGTALHRTHDLTFLLDRLPASVPIPTAIKNLPSLTKYAVQMRYPGATIPATASDRRRAVKLATAAISWAGQVVAGRQDTLF